MDSLIDVKVQKSGIKFEPKLGNETSLLQVDQRLRTNLPPKKQQASS